MFLMIGNISANNIITISENMYAIDNQLNLIIVNQDVEQINAQWSEPKTGIFIDRQYEFENAVENIVLGTAYHVVPVDEPSATFVLYFTQLPLIKIVAPQEIGDSYIYSDLTLVETNQNVMNLEIKIRLRGGSSLVSDKKSYRVELFDIAGDSSVTHSLLGMRNDDDWNLQSAYNEPLRIRSKSNNEFWKKVHTLYYQELEPEAKSGITSEYAEMFLNDEYKGLYLLTERVDRKLMKLKKYNGAVRGQLYKGAEVDSATNFLGAPQYDNTITEWSGFELDYPDEIIDWSYLFSFINFVATSSNLSLFAAVPDLLYLENLADFHIVMNLIGAANNLTTNLFIAKYKSNEPYYYVPWDLDATMGLASANTDEIYKNGLIERLEHDCSSGGFDEILKYRWNLLYNNIISLDTIMKIYEQNYNYLLNNGVYEREAIAWDGFVYDENNYTFISNWLSNRLPYLNDYFNLPCNPVEIQENTNNNTISIYPNPATNYAVLRITEQQKNSFENLSIININGQTVFEKTLNDDTEILISTKHLNNGIYLVVLKGNNEIQTKKLIIN